MKILNVVQNSPEWYAAKHGIPSSSNFHKVVTIDGKPSKQRAKYLCQLAGEIITGVSGEAYQSKDMLRGKEIETEARELYQMLIGKAVKEVGFCLAMGYGCSPDGLVGDKGLVEIKCPIMATQVGYLLANTLPTDYFQQLQGQMLVTSRAWVDFFSYYPGLKPLFIRVKRDKNFLKLLEKELKIFCKNLKVVVRKIK